MSKEISRIDAIFSHTFVINLDSRKDRWQHIHKSLSKYGIKHTRFPAVSYKLFGTFENDKMNPRQGACFMSHLSLVSMAKLARWGTVAIFEDDVVFTKNFMQKLDRFLKAVPDDWDMLLLGTVPFSTEIKINSEVKRPKNSIGSWSYIVRDKAFDAFIDIRSNGSSKNDVYTALLQKKLNVYAPVEGLTAQKKEFKSDIKQMNYGRFLDKWSKDHDFDYTKIDKI